MNKHAKMLEILRRLKKAYGAPRPFKATDPIDELIRTILSQNTSDRNSLAAFSELKKHFKHWGDLIAVDSKRIATVIKHAGLANIKAKRIRDVLLEIRRREGKIDLSILKGLDVSRGREYLTSLKGVGPKTAACVLLFSFRKPVMPVDTHIYRVAKRLRLISSDVNIEEAHQVLTEMSLGEIVEKSTLRAPNGRSNPIKEIASVTSLPRNDPIKAGLIYELHLCIIEHGRRTCRAQNPRCGFCVLYNMCSFTDKSKYKNSR